MTKETLPKEIEKSVHSLLDMVRNSTWNTINNDCRYIITEINKTQENFHVQRRVNKKENDKKKPVALNEVIPILQDLYENLYDINLYLYKATKKYNIIDIRYYSKLSLDQEYRQKVLDNPPMLHGKIILPPWLSDKNEKFDINWEHHKTRNKLKLLLLNYNSRTNKS